MRFADLVGQDHVSRTLQNAIAQERVAHAFLFTGVRGVGKTTSARILAKALNCRAPLSERTGAEPCLKCAACEEITQGVDVDVREIDGASYTGVDEVRKLLEWLPYQPARDRFKLLVIDEVHMLSNNAWNALLKTLEEPPSHVKFILATTEVHKVPVTILSRVQRFDFKLIPARVIADRVSDILQSEKVETDKRSVALVAREAAGSMRDALSLLDQVIAFSSAGLQSEEVARVLGVAGYASLSGVIAAVVGGEPSRALEATAALAQRGCDAGILARDLLHVVRNAVVCKVASNPGELLDLSAEELEATTALAAKANQEEWLRVEKGFFDGFDAAVRSADPLGALDMLLVRLSLRPPLTPIPGLVEKLQRLEARLLTSGRRPPAGRAATPAQAESRDRPRTPEATRARRSATARASEANDDEDPAGAVDSQEINARAASELHASTERASAGVKAGEPEATTRARQAPRERPTAPHPQAPERGGGAGEPLPSIQRRAAAPVSASTLATPALPAPPATAPAAPSPRAEPRAERRGAAAPAGQPLAAAATPDAATVAAGEEVNASGVSNDALARFRSVLNWMDSESPDLSAVLRHGRPVRFDKTVLDVRYEPGHVLAAEAAKLENREKLTSACKACLDWQPRVEISSGEAPGPTLADAEREGRERRRAEALRRASAHPSVRQAVEILGARVKHIELSEG